MNLLWIGPMMARPSYRGPQRVLLVIRSLKGDLCLVSLKMLS